MGSGNVNFYLLICLSCYANKFGNFCSPSRMSCFPRYKLHEGKKKYVIYLSSIIYSVQEINKD